jgi:hypothetical protein
MAGERGDAALRAGEVFAGARRIGTAGRRRAAVEDRRRDRLLGARHIRAEDQSALGSAAEVGGEGSGRPVCLRAIASYPTITNSVTDETRSGSHTQTTRLGGGGEGNGRAMMKKVLAALVAATGFAAALVAILTAPSPLRSLTFELLLGFALVLICLLGVPEVLRSYRARRSLPSEGELEGLRGFRVEQATSNEVAWIADLEASVYSPGDAIPEGTLREWFSVNPAGFSIVRDPSGKAIGHLDILPLRPVTMDAFRKGDIVEREIRGDSLYSPSDRAAITSLYVESIILRPERANAKGPVLLYLLENLPAIFGRVADEKIVEKLYAMAATPAGEQLMKKLGFDLECAGERRKDGHGLFVVRIADFTAKVAELLGKIRRYPSAGAGPAGANAR